ncbi:MAG: ribosomal RNA small subunit methyltransferase A, partial [Anaerolineales bacterium]|nr:ribosomal RNA small subunit methyltransferase A [Anaerolineales bacterium]
LNVPALLRTHGLTPKNSLGQNFLTHPALLEPILHARQVTPTDTILEIGPGLGSLTRHLAARAARVLAVELDQHLIPLLREVLTPYPNVQIIHGDILQLDPKTILNDSAIQQINNQQSTITNYQLPNHPLPPYLVIANIPYYITSAVIRHLLESGHPPTRIVLTIQREVAERICATADRPHKADPQMSLLALSVQVYGQPTIVAHIPASAFYPAPQVDSAIVRVDLYPEPRIPAPHLNTFFRLAKAGYGQKRKTIRNAFLGGLGWPKEKVDTLLQAAHLDPMRRAETLTLEEWGHLVNATLE